MIRQKTKEELRRGKASRLEFGNLPKQPIYLVLDNLKCAHNVGTIIRLADALLVQKVFLCGNTPLPPSKKVRKGSLGAERWVTWEHHENTLSVIDQFKQHGVTIVGAEIATGSVDYRHFSCRFPAAIILGNEEHGIADEILQLCDMVVHLPIHGMANSLNVATVAAVLLYELADRTGKGEF